MSKALRGDLQLITNWIKPHSRVLDLGCGDGSLLAYLQQEKNVTAVGIDLEDQSMQACVEKGVDMIQQNLEDGLAMFEDKQFDTVVLSETLQVIMNTETVLSEMARVAHFGVISFPNFGYWENWWSIIRGRMPMNDQMPYEWYNTPNIHWCTLNDFEALAKSWGFKILNRATFKEGKHIRFIPHWRSQLAVYHFATNS